MEIIINDGLDICPDRARLSMSSGSLFRVGTLLPMPVDAGKWVMAADAPDAAKKGKRGKRKEDKKKEWVRECELLLLTYVRACEAFGPSLALTEGGPDIVALRSVMAGI